MSSFVWGPMGDGSALSEPYPPERNMGGIDPCPMGTGQATRAIGRIP